MKHPPLHVTKSKPKQNKQKTRKHTHRREIFFFRQHCGCGGFKPETHHKLQNASQVNWKLQLKKHRLWLFVLWYLLILSASLSICTVLSFEQGQSEISLSLQGKTAKPRAIKMDCWLEMAVVKPCGLWLTWKNLAEIVQNKLLGLQL